MSDNFALKLVMWLFLGIGLIFFVVGIGIGIHDRNMKKRCSEKVTAVITENREVLSKSDNHISRTYSPVFRYTYNGTEYTQNTGYSSNPPVFEVGDNTEIFVDPSDPNKIYVPKLKVAKLLTVIFTLLGGAFLIVGVILLIISRRKTYMR